MIGRFFRRRQVYREKVAKHVKFVSRRMVVLEYPPTKRSCIVEDRKRGDFRVPIVLRYQIFVVRFDSLFGLLRSVEIYESVTQPPEVDWKDKSLWVRAFTMSNVRHSRVCMGRGPWRRLFFASLFRSRRRTAIAAVDRFWNSKWEYASGPHDYFSMSLTLR